MGTSMRVLGWTTLLLAGLAAGCSPSDSEGNTDVRRDDGGTGEVVDDDAAGGDADVPADEPGADDWVAPEIPDITPEVCDEADFDIARVIPDMLIVLDRSNSMFDDGYWNPARDAIYAVTSAMDFEIWFGLMIFPNVTGSAICSGLSNQCEPGHEPIVPVLEGNAIAIMDSLGSMVTCGGTPIAVTLQNARAYLDTLAADGHPKFVLLVTDGAPNCNDALDGATCTCTSPMGCILNSGNCLDDARTISIIDDMRLAGLQVFVMGIGTSAWMGTLDAMAAAGGTGMAFLAEDTAAIRTTFEEIAGSVATCEFDMQSPDPSADPNLVNFYFDDVVVPGDTDGTCDNGWSWMDADHTRVQFCGDYCNAIMTHTVTDISATWGCPTILR
ncbi:MAG: VWA domain-containing protein [Deltaproteobacteria bacterium]|nr:VWA domain-containing protein [Deltaproteobacteria bacterium]